MKIAWYGMVRYGTVWYGTVWYSTSAVSSYLLGMYNEITRIVWTLSRDFKIFLSF